MVIRPGLHPLAARVLGPNRLQSGVVQRALSASEYAHVEAYLMDKYAL